MGIFSRGHTRRPSKKPTTRFSFSFPNDTNVNVYTLINPQTPAPTDTIMCGCPLQLCLFWSKHTWRRTKSAYDRSAVEPVNRNWVLDWLTRPMPPSQLALPTSQWALPAGPAPQAWGPGRGVSFAVGCSHLHSAHILLSQQLRVWPPLWFAIMFPLCLEGTVFDFCFGVMGCVHLLLLFCFY